MVLLCSEKWLPNIHIIVFQHIFFYPLNVWYITVNRQRITCLLYLLGSLENENLCLRIFSAKLIFSNFKPARKQIIIYIIYIEVHSCSLPCWTGNCTKWALCDHYYLIRNVIFFFSPYQPQLPCNFISFYFPLFELAFFGFILICICIERKQLYQGLIMHSRKQLPLASLQHWSALLFILTLS